MRKIIGRLAKDRSGSNALEYGLIIGLVSLVVVFSAALAGSDLSAFFIALGGLITSATTGI